MQHNDDDLRPKVGVGVMVLKNGKVLIGKRKGGPIIADVGPYPTGHGFALGQNRTVVSSPCSRAAPSTCSPISATSGARFAVQAPTQSASVETSRSMPSRPKAFALAVERLMMAVLGIEDHRDYARATLDDVPYDRWREYDPEDTMRFYALRLREAGLIKSSPQKIIADGTDWRFLNELKRELKA
jgi:hypothetical protein